MEPTLHCARPADGCLAGHSDRVVANRFIYRFRDPKRGEIVVFDAPAETLAACGETGTFVKRIVGLPGDTVQGRDGHVWVNGKLLVEPYLPRGTVTSDF
jgi:signal peptidase I